MAKNSIPSVGSSWPKLLEVACRKANYKHAKKMRAQLNKAIQIYHVQSSFNPKKRAQQRKLMRKVRALAKELREVFLDSEEEISSLVEWFQIEAIETQQFVNSLNSLTIAASASLSSEMIGGGQKAGRPENSPREKLVQRCCEISWDHIRWPQDEQGGKFEMIKRIGDFTNIVLSLAGEPAGQVLRHKKMCAESLGRLGREISKIIRPHYEKKFGPVR